MTDQPLNMRESAVAMNEWFNNMLDSGFTRTEALYLIGCAISPVGPQPPKEGDIGD